MIEDLTADAKKTPVAKEAENFVPETFSPSRKPYLDFEPIKIKGEPLSVTILRDRGPY